MEKSLLLTAEKIVFQLRQCRSDKTDLVEIIKLLDHVEKHGCENKTQQYRIVDDTVQLLTNATTNNTTDAGSIIGCVTWLTYLQEQQKLALLNESQFDKLFQWLWIQLRCGDINELVCRICIAFSGLFAIHPVNGNKYFLKIFRLNKEGILKYVSGDNTYNVIINAIQCLDNLLSSLKDVQLSDEQSEVCEEAGRRILQIYYGDTKPNVDAENLSILILHSLQILHKLVTLQPNFAKLHIAELLGLSKMYFHFNVDTTEIALTKPQKVYMSQQALYDSAEEIESKIHSDKARSCGGKTPKTRKPRAVVKNTHSNDNRNGVNRSPEGRVGVLTFDMKTSDSDVSEPENATNRVLYERNRRAKIRLASITLVGTVARILERRIIYGYWHSLFPSGSGESIDNLLYVGQHDPNLRCRSAALQVCAQLLYGSKGFLHQAEINVTRCPTTFIPFSVSLGFTVLAIYKSLITILASESSLPVLTQTLKCMAVLVQATPFQQFEKGFVQDFVNQVKPFIYHRDVTIQVSALMVMEFLVATPEITLDIAEAVGLPLKAATRRNISKGKHISDEEIEIVDIEEFVEDEEDIGDVDNNDIDKCTQKCQETINFSDKTQCNDTSWLLLRILYNLGSQDKAVASTSVRIESFQVLIAISSHFAMLKPCLTQVSKVLQYSLNDSLSDVRLYAARCVDTCAFQINRYLLDNVSCSTSAIRECHKFWLDLMPIVVGRIRRDSDEMITVRIALCDALSNIGVLMYEHMPHSSQISLLSFLSGVSSDGTEDNVVRAAAVRALAVFALYPSLRGDLVFIENTAELTLPLVKDSSLLVRIKGFWSLGNISDALIAKSTDGSAPTQERISDDLLYRLINVATLACADNDKVRCNAVRTLGNLLRLLADHHFQGESTNMNWRQTFEKAICKLTDCIRSSGNAKVKWNSCYAVSNLMRNRTIFKVTDLNWQNTLYPALCHVIVHHSNFKVRINATSAIINIAERSHFGNYFEQFWTSMLEAIEQSYNLDNFHEYNHRDSLQEQLCLALAHIINCAGNDDLAMIKRHTLPHVETIRNTWKRVINRMVPEKADPLLSCSVVLLERGKAKDILSMEQKNAVEFLMETFAIE